MCGIIGVVGEKVGSVLFQEGLKTLKHRGPENSGWLDETVGAKEVMIGHTRLSIIDLSQAGNQPMRFGETLMSYNGEVYNFKELREKYLQNDSLKSTSDSEVILHLYSKLGQNFINQLNGDFAIAFLDKNEGKIKLYRDRFGVKPLYIYHHRDTFAFASEIKAFRAMGLALTLDREEVGRYLVYKYTPGQKTLFNEVRRVRPASELTFDIETGTISERTYWSLPEGQKYQGSYREAKEQIRELFGRSVSRRLIADVPIANYLSGGVDSSIIGYHVKDGGHTHFCAVKSTRDLAAEGTTSDGYYARKLAEEWDLNLSEIEIGRDQLTTELIRQAVWACDDLIADGSAIPAMLIAEKASENYKVVLSGMGADEIFFGYNGHFLLQLDQLTSKIPGLKAVLSPLLRQIEPGKGSFKAYKRYLKKWADNQSGPYSAARFSLVGDVQSAIFLSAKQPSLDFLFSDLLGQENSFENLMSFELSNFLVKNNHYLDRTSMAYGLESRVPYLDHEFVEFVSSLPTDWKLDWKFKSKKILKDAYADVLPGFITKRRKAGFGMPLRSLLSQKIIIKELIDRELLGDLNLFDMDNFHRLIQDHTTGKADQSALIYALISFQEWYKLFFQDSVPVGQSHSLISQ
jgi:asparagine synthase (glutamine-hydrolysing)